MTNEEFEAAYTAASLGEAKPTLVYVNPVAYKQMIPRDASNERRKELTDFADNCPAGHFIALTAESSWYVDGAQFE